jgi:hypothetical protein
LINEEKEQEGKAEEAKKKKKQEVETRETPQKNKGEKPEKKKKKKQEEKDKEVLKKDQEEKKAPAIAIREKSAIKKTKVHRALKISSPDDSEGASGPKEDPVKENEPMVEKDHVTSTEGEDGGVHKDTTTPVAENAPNSEKKDGPPLDSDNDGKEVHSNLFPSIYHFSSNS